MSKVIDILNNSKSPFASFELVPPLKGSDSSKLFASIEPLLQFCPPFLNVTCHRDEVEYCANDDGTYTRMVLSKRPSTIAIIASAMIKYNVEMVPHVICGGASRSKVESEIIDLNFLGIENVMALRGDAAVGQRFFQPESDGFAHASEMVAMIQNLNHGRYLDPTVRNGISTNFCVGVAGYPEKHYEATNMESDIQNLRRKVDAGADYIITQMFFDNQRFYDFVAQCRKADITVPIIPGLKPISTIKQLELLPRSFHIDIPQPLVNELQKAKTKEAVYQVGIEWCEAQSRDLLAHGVPAIHYYTMAKTDNICQIVNNVF